MPTPDDVGSYVYLETVFVSGDLKKYLGDLENYFRRSARDMEESVGTVKRKLASLDQDIAIYEEFHHRLDDDYGCPFHVNETNYQRAREWLTGKIGNLRKMRLAQRMNQGRVLGVVEDGLSLNKLDLTNYAYDGNVVRISYDPSSRSIRMRIFSSDGRSPGEGFAIHARNHEGIEAECATENGVGEEILPLDAFLEKGKLRRSGHIVKPNFKIVCRDDEDLVYSVQLSDPYLTMLDMIGVPSSRDSPMKSYQGVRYGNSLWSPSQAEEMLRNLFGILALDIRRGGRGGWYAGVFVPMENGEAVRRSLENGIFTKTINGKSRPVLSAVYRRSVELRNAHSDFYPRFTVRETARRSGLNMKKARNYLDSLIGVLAFTHDNRQPKWFVPRSSFSLINDLAETD
jgi:hypothetical protein